MEKLELNNLSLLNCAYVDVKTSMLLNRRFEDTHSGNYDGCRGPSQPLQQKRKAETNVERANEIGRDIIDYEVDMSKTPTLVSKTDALTEESGSEPPKRVVKSKLFASQIAVSN